MDAQSKQAPRGSLVITEPDRLAEVLATVLRKKGKSANAIAKECGINQGQLSRLLNGKLKRVTTLTYQRLLSVAPPDDMSEIRRLFLPDNARAAISAHEGRLHELENSPEAKLGLSEEERAFVGGLAAEYPKVSRALQKLVRVYAKRRHSYVRWVAALRNVLEPLNRFFTTLGVERGFHELSKDELATFVAHGLERERILLDRDPDLVRAQRAAENVHQTKAMLKARTAHFGVGRPYCWDFVRPRHHLTLEEFGALEDVHGAGTAADPYVFDTESPLKRPRRRRGKYELDAVKTSPDE